MINEENNVMPFKSTTSRYGALPPPETPFQRAGQVWDDRMGAARVQAKNWRIVAFASLALSAGLVVAYVSLASTTRITPYVVEVDQLGTTRAVGPAVETYQPSDAQIAYALSQFIEDVRALPLDPVMLRRNWLRAYDHATTQGAAVLNADAQVRDPFSKLGRETVTVEVTSVVRVSPDSFEVRWREAVAPTGSAPVAARYTGIITLVTRTPHDAQTLKKNPLGVYVQGFNYSRDLMPGEGS